MILLVSFSLLEGGESRATLRSTQRGGVERGLETDTALLPRANRGRVEVRGRGRCCSRAFSGGRAGPGVGRVENTYAPDRRAEPARPYLRNRPLVSNGAAMPDVKETAAYFGGGSTFSSALSEPGSTGFSTRQLSRKRFITSSNFFFCFGLRMARTSESDASRTASTSGWLA